MTQRTFDPPQLAVGSTLNIRKRILAHIRPWETSIPFATALTNRAESMRDCEQVKFKISLRYGDWFMWEARLIRYLQPPANSLGVHPKNRFSFTGAKR